MDAKQYCPLCNSENCIISPAAERSDVSLIKCPNCFDFKLHDGVTSNYNKNSRQMLNAIYSFLLEDPFKSFGGINYYFYFYYDNEGKSENPININASLLLNDYPKTLLEKVDKILYNLSLRHPTYNSYLEPKDMNPSMFYCESNDLDTEMHVVFQFMKDYGFVDKSGTMITIKGWERIDELRKECKTLKQGFIAMWFPQNEDPKFEFMSGVREAIKKAITDSGFSFMIIDEKEHNNQIVPEILFEIKNSKFLIADITGHRNGVYYEAGIMEGLGRQVIVCCNKADFDKRHFDIAQKSAIIYENKDELYEKLKNRIRATI